MKGSEASRVPLCIITRPNSTQRPKEKRPDRTRRIVRKRQVHCLIGRDANVITVARARCETPSGAQPQPARGSNQYIITETSSYSLGMLPIQLVWLVGKAISR